MSAPLPALEAALQRCAKKETSGLAQLYKEIAPPMLALAQNVLNNDALARQALHDSIVLVWQHAGQYNPVYGTAHAWVFSILRYRLQALQNQASINRTTRVSLAKGWITEVNPDAKHFNVPLQTHLNQDSARFIALAYCMGLRSDDIASALNIDVDIVLADLNLAFNTASSATHSYNQVDNAQIAFYVLGLLNGTQLANVQSAITEDDNALQQALFWEAEFFQLTRLLPSAAPDEQTWDKIQKTLKLTIIPQPLKTPEKAARPATPDAKQQTASWAATPNANPELSTPEAPDTNKNATPHEIKNKPRHRGKMLRILATAIFALLSTLALYVWLAPIEPTLTTHNTDTNNENAVLEPLSLHTVVLQPPGSTSTPGWVIVSREPGVLHIEPLLKSQLANNESLVLWRRKPNSPTTQKLGVINDSGPSKIQLTSGFSIVEPMLYGITVERNPAQLSEPQGDIVFIGQSFRLKVPDPEPEEPVAPLQ